MSTARTPACYRCRSDRKVAIYDLNRQRLPLCESCAPTILPVVESCDLARVAVSGVCWCSNEHVGLTVLWCPHINSENT